MWAVGRGGDPPPPHPGTHPLPTPNHHQPTLSSTTYSQHLPLCTLNVLYPTGHRHWNRPLDMKAFLVHRLWPAFFFLAWILSPNPNIKIHASRNTKPCNKVWGGSTNDVQHCITSNDEKLQVTSSYQQRNDWIMLTSAQATKRPLKRITW